MRPRVRLSSVSLADLAALATALGVVGVALQLWYSRTQARTALEDGLTTEYREIVLNLPTDAFFEPSEARTADGFMLHLRDYLRYVDLCNQQVFLRSQRRVSRKTWLLWRDGMEDNLTSRPDFLNAWAYLQQNMWRSFDELRRLAEDWDVDPGWWDPPWWRRPVRRLRSRLTPNTSRGPTKRLRNADHGSRDEGITPPLGPTTVATTSSRAPQAKQKQA
jgi:hypothetical protein